jgi:anti-sigma factor RsiW
LRACTVEARKSDGKRMMSCQEVEAQIEALAGGEPASPPVRAHLDACPGCASALDRARRIDRLLQSREVPRAPAGFTAAVIARLSRERWQSEQVLDWGFNIAIASGLLLMIAGGWLLLNLSGLTEVTVEALGASREVLLSQLRQTLPTYGSALLLVVATLGVWWWADRRVSP